MSSIKVFVQARMSSVRLPGKVLMEFGGVPVIAHVIRNLEEIFDPSLIVVVTSDQSSDDQLVAKLKVENIKVIRGPLDDVLGRFILAARQESPKWILRICGDSPLIKSKVVKLVVDGLDENFDLVTNTFPRSFPKGQSVELIKYEALEKLSDMTNDRDEREHVTKGFYNRAHLFKIKNIKNPEGDQSYLSDVLDTPEDLVRIKKNYEERI